MMIDIAGGAGAIVVVAVVGLVLSRSVGRRKVELELVPEVQESSAWRLLTSDDEVREAIQRAIACEQASMDLCARRAERLIDMREQLEVVAATPRLPRQPHGLSMPEAS